MVCFSPLPSGGALTKELNAVAKGFGPLKNTLLLPSRVINTSRAVYYYPLTAADGTFPLV